MMGTWLPETCWEINRREIKNTKVTSSWFFLSTLNYDARSTTHQNNNVFLCIGKRTLNLKEGEPNKHECGDPILFWREPALLSSKMSCLHILWSLDVTLALTLGLYQVACIFGLDCYCYHITCWTKAISLTHIHVRQEHNCHLYYLPETK